MLVFILLISLTFSKSFGNDIVSVLKNNGGKTFVSLAEKVGLLDELRTDNLTVFAPSDQAFAKLPVFLLQVLKQDNKTLSTMIRYHMIKGEVTSSNLESDMKLVSVMGRPIRINIYNSNKLILAEGTKIIRPDKIASNGVVHILDRIMRPPHGTILELLHSDSDNSKFLELIERTSLRELLNNTGANLTVFAPTNAAFSDPLSKLYIDDIINNTDLLTDVLKYHILPRTVYHLALKDGTFLSTLMNTTDQLELRNFDLGLHVDNSLITLSDSSASNGVLHQVDNVLIPDSMLSDVGVTMKVTVNSKYTSASTSSNTRPDLSLLSLASQTNPFMHSSIDLAGPGITIDATGSKGSPETTTSRMVPQQTTTWEMLKKKGEFDNFRIGSIPIDLPEKRTLQNTVSSDSGPGPTTTNSTTIGSSETFSTSNRNDSVNASITTKVKGLNTTTGMIDTTTKSTAADRVHSSKNQTQDNI